MGGAAASCSSYDGNNALGLEDILYMDFLDSLSASDVEDLILLDSIKKPKRYSSRRGLFNLETLDDVTVKRMFRFQKGDIDRLFRALQMPSVVTVQNNVRIPGREALCITLRRLAYPNRLCELEDIFGRHYSTISSTATAVVRHIVSTFGHLLKNLSANSWLVPETLQNFADVSHFVLLQHTCYSASLTSHNLNTEW